MRPLQILQIHRAEIADIMKRYPMFSNLRVVGSVARGEDTEESDIDFLVDSASGATLFDRGGLLGELERLMGIPVDIISTKDHLNKFVKDFFAQDAVQL